MSNKKQTAVEWFHKETWSLKMQKECKEITEGEYAVDYFDLFEQAKAMDKQQKKDAWEDGWKLSDLPPMYVETQSEKYYEDNYE